MTTVKFVISGKSMSTIEGSEIFISPKNYDGGSQGAQDAFASLRACRRRRQGKGYSYPIETTEAGAESIREYCVTVGETFAFESEPDTRADGRALLSTAAKITKAVAAAVETEVARLREAWVKAFKDNEAHNDGEDWQFYERAENQAHDALVDYVEAHGLNYSTWDPRSYNADGVCIDEPTPEGEDAR